MTYPVTSEAASFVLLRWRTQNDEHGAGVQAGLCKAMDHGRVIGVEIEIRRRTLISPSRTETRGA